MTKTPTLAQLLKQAMNNRLLDMHTALIAKVESYHIAMQQVNVSPVLKRPLPTLDDESAEEQLPMICDVPVLFPRANGFFISFPIKPGDLVQVIFNEKIGLQGAVAIPGVYADSPLSDAHEKNLVLGKDKGVQIHIDGDKIKLGSDKASEALAIASKVK
ncbi:MAG: Gp138 family membrane-puncturing spike protein, partial [Minisyncoccia bacterium]